MYGKFSKLGPIHLEKEDIFGGLNRVYDKVIDRVITNDDWEWDVKVTFLCRKHDTPNTYVVVASTPGDVYSDNEWYIGPSWTKHDIIRYQLSNTPVLEKFLQNCVTQIEAENVKC